jgi:heat-inducible transcriptional repressor
LTAGQTISRNNRLYILEVALVDQLTSSISNLNSRSREVFRLLVESYLDTGEPMGSRTLTRSLNEQVSAATIRNVMQDLEYLGSIG